MKFTSFFIFFFIIINNIATAQTISYQKDTLLVNDRPVFIVKKEKSYFSVINLGGDKKSRLSGRINSKTCYYTFYLRNKIDKAGQKDATIAQGVFMTNSADTFLTTLAREVEIDVDGNWNEAQVAQFIQKHTEKPSKLSGAANKGREKLEGIFGQ